MVAVICNRPLDPLPTWEGAPLVTPPMKRAAPWFVDSPPMASYAKVLKSQRVTPKLGSLLDVRCYWVTPGGGGGRKGFKTDFTPPHHMFHVSIHKEWNNARETDPRLCHSTRNGPKSTIQESGAGVCGVDERFTRFSIAFLDPKTGKETEVHACAEAGNPYAHATVKAAARLEVLRRFGHAHRVVAGAFKDSDELLAKKKQVDRDWRYVMDTLNKHGDTYPQIHEIFELIADEERAALLCHAKHHGSNRGRHRLHGEAIRKWCAQYGDDWWW